jgi:DNA-binding transcriptional MerR regulator
MYANELAKSAGVSASVVRYYTRIGLLTPDRNPDNGYRQYAPTDVERVRFIRKAKWLGFTLKDVETILERSDLGQSPCQKVRAIILERIRENQQRLQHLQAIQDRMVNAVESWHRMEDGLPGRRVCRLIDNLDCDEEMLDLHAGYKF